MQKPNQNILRKHASILVIYYATLNMLCIHFTKGHGNWVQAHGFVNSFREAETSVTLSLTCEHVTEDVVNGYFPVAKDEPFMLQLWQESPVMVEEH